MKGKNMNKCLAAMVVLVVLFNGCGKIKKELRGPQGESIQGTQGIPGNDGQDGEDGVPGEAAILEVVDPCGDAPGIYDEVVLRLSNGQLLSSFSENSNGKNTRFSILTQGNYVTTDGSNCHFVVTPDGQVN